MNETWVDLKTETKNLDWTHLENHCFNKKLREIKNEIQYICKDKIKLKKKTNVTTTLSVNIRWSNIIHISWHQLKSFMWVDTWHYLCYK